MLKNASYSRMDGDQLYDNLKVGENDIDDEEFCNEEQLQGDRICVDLHSYSENDNHGYSHELQAYGGFAKPEHTEVF